MDELSVAPVTCPHCGNVIINDYRFCVSCGNKLPAAISSDQKKNISPRNLTWSLVLFFAIILFCIYIKFFHHHPSPEFSLQTDILLSVAVMIAAVAVFSDIKQSLKIEKLQWQYFLFVLIAPLLLGFCFHHLAKFINVELYDNTSQMYMFMETNHAILFSFLSICLQPALFEELAFRSVIFQSLGKYMDDHAVVIVSSLMFAFAHLTFVGLIWLLPLGLMLGWLRLKTKTIWYGVIFHMLYNFSAILLSMHDLRYF